MTETSAKETRGNQLERLHSLDAYRGLIMVTLAFVGFGLADTAENHLQQNPDSAVWQNVEYQFRHVQWTGCSYWDLIQPSFMFMVGVSMAYSYAKRKRLGHSYPRMLGHAIWRSLALILLSVFLMSLSSRHEQTHWTFMNVLAQIGLGYTFLFLLWDRKPWVQAAAAMLILIGTAIAYETYPEAGIDLEHGRPEVGVSQEWAQEHLEGVREPWHKNANIGHKIDRIVLNQFPRKEPFEFNKGGYQTINFIPSIATMIFGLMCGGLLRSGRKPTRKLAILIAAGLVGLAVGQVLDRTGLCPSIKRIWTPSWAIFSGGWCCVILGALYLFVDMFRLRWLAFPLIVVGMNSIVIYCMSMTLKPGTARQLQKHFGEGLFTLYGNVPTAWQPTVQATLVGLVFWLVCYYLYRRKIFIAI